SKQVDKQVHQSEQPIPVLRLDAINVSLETDGTTLPILHDITLNFPAGQSAAIIGPSGSGKTTLMMVCAGLQQPQSGYLVFQDEALPFENETAMSAWRQENIGIVFQNFHLLPTNTAL